MINGFCCLPQFLPILREYRMRLTNLMVGNGGVGPFRRNAPPTSSTSAEPQHPGRPLTDDRLRVNNVLQSNGGVGRFRQRDPPTSSTSAEPQDLGRPQPRYRLRLNNLLIRNGDAGRFRWGYPTRGGSDSSPNWMIVAFCQSPNRLVYAYLTPAHSRRYQI